MEGLELGEPKELWSSQQAIQMESRPIPLPGTEYLTFAYLVFRTWKSWITKWMHFLGTRSIQAICSHVFFRSQYCDRSPGTLIEIVSHFLGISSLLEIQAPFVESLHHRHY